jgi:hypothetical protein
MDSNWAKAQEGLVLNSGLKAGVNKQPEEINVRKIDGSNLGP